MLSLYESVGTCVLLCAPQRIGDAATRLLAELALRSMVQVLDGGNRLQAYPLTRALRARSVQVNTLSQRVLIRRAFTAYQMLALLESVPTAPIPCVILDPLAAFYDETLPIGQARLLAQRCLQQVERLKKAAPVFIFLTPAPCPQRAFLPAMICEKTDALFLEQEEARVASQLALF